MRREQPLISTADFKHVLPVGEQWDHTPESEHRFGIRYTMLAPIVGASNLGTSYCEVGQMSSVAFDFPTHRDA